jgi:hypothetical protein
VDRLLPLWTRPVRARDDPRAAFAEVYADPVVVNGTAMTLAELVDRARSLQQAFDRLGMDIVDTVEAPGRIVIAFIMRGRHVGPYRSPLGTVAPTHRDIEVRTIDVLTVSNGLVSAIWVVSDDLALLRQLGAAQLTEARHPGRLDSSRRKRDGDGSSRRQLPGIRPPALGLASFVGR